ncbi:hypothetical protein [uncultured Sphingomonas sp.]|uniref:DUF3108 domain-containing protein n=1 Tax=uncultured Sphingomonas sp. TaxID=158754 RepID=UPI0025E67C9C|nr:hypothetical protein [uncultured Sphingomonas sp.]
MLALMLIAATTMPDVSVPDGSRLREGSACYALTREGKPIGQTWQRVRAAIEGSTPVWDIIVHQRVGDGRFDMRDHFVLRRTDLTPIRMDSRRNGVEHVAVRYDGADIEVARPGQEVTRFRASGKVWDGNLWGLTFAALPLRQGGSYTVPFFQYDKGLGRFALEVTGSEQVDGRSAWRVDVETGGGGQTVRYLIGKNPPEELGTESPMFGQRLGGDCSALAEP